MRSAVHDDIVLAKLLRQDHAIVVVGASAIALAQPEREPNPRLPVNLPAGSDEFFGLLTHALLD
jgi:hypothetical protein